MTDDREPGDGRRFEDTSRSERRRPGRFERAGRPRMSDLGGVAAGARRAVAEAEVSVSQETLSGIVDGTNSRGDVLSVAELAGVMAAKRTAELIPLVHSTPLTELRVEATPERAGSRIRIRAETAASGVAGVEMEALTAAAIAALTVYDMVRESDRSAQVGSVKLVSSGDDGETWQRPEATGQGRAQPPRGIRGAGRIGRAQGRRHP